jgi:hypothetical protein
MFRGWASSEGLRMPGCGFFSQTNCLPISNHIVRPPCMNSWAVAPIVGRIPLEPSCHSFATSQRVSIHESLRPVEQARGSTVMRHEPEEPALTGPQCP